MRVRAGGIGRGENQSGHPLTGASRESLATQIQSPKVHPGDCHYIEGNAHAAEQFTKVRLVVALLGLEPERLRLEWISGAEGPRFAAVINEFTEQVRALGPTGLGRATAEPVAVGMER